MTDAQLYLAIGVPLAGNALLAGILMLYINHRFQDVKDVWKAELRRVEEVLDARLKHLEER